MIKQVNFIDPRKGRQRYPDGENRVLNLYIVQQEIDVRLAAYVKRVYPASQGAVTGRF